MIRRIFGHLFRSPALLVGVLACGRSAPAPVPASDPVADPCRIAGTEGHALDTIRIALTDSFQVSGFLEPNNPSERLIGTQLYRSFLRRTCDDRWAGDLAERWALDSNAGAWRMVVKESSALPETWLDSSLARMMAAGLIGAGSRSDGPRQALLEVASIDSARPAEPGFWATTHQPGLRQPDGTLASTGRYRGADPSSAESGSIVLAPVVGSSPPLRFRVVSPQVDLRDLMDATGPDRADVIVTRDPLVVAYGQRRPQFQVVPLGWDRIYLMVGAPPLDTASAEAQPGDDLSTVRGETRPVPLSWAIGGQCEVPNRSGRLERIIGYRRDDPIARDLAERIVALAGRQDPPRWLPAGYLARSPGDRLMARGYPAAALDSLVASGAVLGAIVAAPRRRQPGCRGLAWPSGSGVVPLIESRPVALLRRGVGPIRIDGFGTLVFLGSEE